MECGIRYCNAVHAWVQIPDEYSGHLQKPFNILRFTFLAHETEKHEVNWGEDGSENTET
jgi:hypothetical protein